MLTMPRTQFNHRYIDSKITTWLDLHFPADSRFNGRIFMAYRRKDSAGIYNLTRSNIGDLSSFVTEIEFPVLLSQPESSVIAKVIISIRLIYFILIYFIYYFSSPFLRNTIVL